MTHPTLFITPTLPLPQSVSPSPLRCGLLFISLALACFSLSQTTQAQDGDELNGNTAEGRAALFTYISTASSASQNTAVGDSALHDDTSGSDTRP
jgi:hypothetical protein